MIYLLHWYVVVAWLGVSCEYQKKFCKVSTLYGYALILRNLPCLSIFFSRIKRNARDVLMGFGERE